MLNDTSLPAVDARPRCGNQKGGLTCDRLVGHADKHRGYLEQHDAVLFWDDPTIDEKLTAMRVRAEQAEQRILALEQKLEASTGTLKTVCQRIVHEQQWRGQAEARLARLVDGLEALERHGFSPFVSEWGAAVRALIAAAKQERSPS